MNTVLKLVRSDAVAQADTNPLPTFLELFETYLERKKSRLKPMTVKGYKQLVRAELADWHDLRIDSITRKLCADKHNAISNRNGIYGKGEMQADHCFRLVRALFNFATALYRNENDEALLKQNPTEVLKESRSWNRQKPRTNYLHEDQLPVFWKATATSEYSVIRDWLRFTLLTAFRKSESRLLKWRDVDFKQRTITLKNTKNGRDHVFPITAYLMKLLQNRRKYTPPEVEYVFNHPDGTNSPLSYNTRRQDQISIQSGIHFRLHDLRRTYAQCCYANELSDVALKSLLNHVATGVTQRHYIGAVNLRAIRGPAQRVEDYIISYATGELVAPSEVYQDDDEAEEIEPIEPPKPKEKIRIRLMLQPVEPVEQPIAKPLVKPAKPIEAGATEEESTGRPYRKPDYEQLRKYADENRARVGGVEF